MRKGGITSREIEDVAGESANAAEMKAAASGNPLILEEIDLRQKVRRLESQRSEHDREQHRIRARIRNTQQKHQRNDEALPAYDQNASAAAALAKEDFSATITGTTVDKPSEMGAAILKAALAMVEEHAESRPLGSYGPFKLRLEYIGANSVTVVIDGATEHSVYVDELKTAPAAGVGMRVLNTIRRLVDVPAAIRAENAEIQTQIPSLERQIRPWPAEQELQDTVARHQAVLAALKPKPAAAPVDADFSIDPASPRRFGFPAGKFPAISAYSDDTRMKQHTDYRAAKAGDVDAAARLIPAIVPQNMLERASVFGADVIFVAPLAEEASGHNAIPGALAHYLASMTDGGVEDRIVQASRAFHTGARPLDRLLGRPLFFGPVEPGRKYVLVDDVTVMGGTLAELANHIRSNVGEVVGTVTLVNTSRSGIKRAPKQLVRLVEERYGEIVREEFGIDPEALTGDEALVILGFRDADALRAGISAAKVNRERHLLQKGLRTPPAKEAESRIAPDGWGVIDTSNDVPALSETDLQEIRDIVRQVSGLSDVTFTRRIDLPRGAPGWGTDAPTTAGGFYDPATDAITIALDNAAGPHTAYHEAFHRLQRLFMSDKERAVLKAEVGHLRRMVAGRMGREAQAGRMSAKEVEAEALAIYSSQPDTRIHKTLAAAWNRLARLVRQVRNYLPGRGFQTAEDIFERAQCGEIAGRTPRPSSRTRQEFRVLDDTAFKRWFRGSKVVDDQGKPLVVYHGTSANFEAFDPARAGSATGDESAKMGFFFASNPDVASSYAYAFNFYRDTKLGRILNKLSGGLYEKANEAIV